MSLRLVYNWRVRSLHFNLRFLVSLTRDRLRILALGSVYEDHLRSPIEFLILRSLVKFNGRLVIYVKWFIIVCGWHTLGLHLVGSYGVGVRIVLIEVVTIENVEPVLIVVKYSVWMRQQAREESAESPGDKRDSKRSAIRSHLNPGLLTRRTSSLQPSHIWNGLSELIFVLIVVDGHTCGAS